MSASEIAGQIAERLDDAAASLERQWATSEPIRHFAVDDLLPEATAREIADHLPSPGLLMKRNSPRERKKVGVRIEDYAPIVGEALLAFQDPAVIEAVGGIVGWDGLRPDPSLYASGLSAMERGDFLNPHLDNSHDGDQRLYRAVNLLYYTSPDWRAEDGGNLELWPPAGEPIVLPASFNRLVVMQTDRTSWHSVDAIRSDRPRWCVSNYFFSADPLTGGAYRHVTTFRGRPGEPIRGAVLALDGFVRGALGRLFPSLLTRTPHRRRPDD